MFQKVRQRYELWNEDYTTIEICIDDDPSPAIELDQQEQKLEQWKIVPLASPSQVFAHKHHYTAVYHHHESCIHAGDVYCNAFIQCA